jgi:hypothetical protein
MCGTAENIPLLIQKIEEQYTREALTELWEFLFHQYTVYPATLATVPHFVRILNRTYARTIFSVG